MDQDAVLGGNGVDARSTFGRCEVSRVSCNGFSSEGCGLLFALTAISLSLAAMAFNGVDLLPWLSLYYKSQLLDLF